MAQMGLFTLLPTAQRTANIASISTNRLVQQNGDERRLLDLCVYVCSLRKLIFKINGHLNGEAKHEREARDRHHFWKSEPGAASANLSNDSLSLSFES